MIYVLCVLYVICYALTTDYKSLYDSNKTRNQMALHVCIPFFNVLVLMTFLHKYSMVNFLEII